MVKRMQRLLNDLSCWLIFPVLALLAYFSGPRIWDPSALFRPGMEQIQRALYEGGPGPGAVLQTGQ
jgi:hypothetical protein